ncbi:peptidase, M16 family [Lachnospiraceae bacterium KM106-2]|nr:peptidase, M16 family [Lachnospiraceae bacterium KM106-2]
MVHVNKLSNGMTVVFEKMEHLRSVSLGVWVKVGSANETNENNGIAHMIEHMLFKGTKNRSAKELADDMAMLGGNMNAYTSKECTSYYVTTLDNHLPIAIDILGDMISNSLFDLDDIEREKEVILEEIDMYDDSPDDLVHEMLQKEVWKDHPLGYIISGTKEIVKGYTREDLIRFKEQYYVADNMVISIVGNFEEEKALYLLEHYFGQIASSSVREEITKPDFTRCFVTSNKDIEQIHMNMAFDCVDYHAKEKYVLSIVNAVLGGSENSRLFQIIREEMGLTYSIYSYGSSYGLAGLFHIDATLNPSKIEKVFEGIVKVIDQLREKGISENELNRAKEQINTELIIGSESSRNRVNSNGKAMLCREKIMSLDDTIQAVNDVTREDALAFIDKYLDYNKLSICLVGNLTDIDLDKMKSKWNELANR